MALVCLWEGGARVGGLEPTLAPGSDPQECLLLLPLGSRFGTSLALGTTVSWIRWAAAGVTSVPRSVQSFLDHFSRFSLGVFGLV